MPGTLRIGTRQSALAQAQATWVADRLRSAFPELQVELVLITTSGDQLPNHPHPSALRSPSSLSRERAIVPPSPYLREKGLGDEGGGLKALFTKEIEEALLDNRIDLAVHSLKDMAAELPKGLCLGAVPEREDPRDVWISKTRLPFKEGPSGAKIGTGSVRRQAQIRHLRPDWELVPLRGNVDTRLRKLKEGNLDGIILALAGLKRLGRQNEVTEILPIETLLPAVGQGCLAIEARENDPRLNPYLSTLDHAPSHEAASAERSFLQTLGGSCQTPIAAHASVAPGQLTLQGLVASPDGKEMLRAKETGRAFDAAGIGQRLAQQLLAAGADKILH